MKNAIFIKGNLGRRIIVIALCIFLITTTSSAAMIGTSFKTSSISKSETTSTEFSEFLLKEAKVAVTPGSSFGKYGEGFLRLSYAASYEDIGEALDRIEKAVRKLPRS